MGLLLLQMVVLFLRGGSRLGVYVHVHERLKLYRPIFCLFYTEKEGERPLNRVPEFIFITHAIAMYI